MFIETEPTPNPSVLKFLPGRAVAEGRAVDFGSPEDAETVSPLAARLFAVEGVARVHLGSSFVSVAKRDDVDWFALKPAVLGAIMEHYLSGDPALSESAEISDGNASCDDDDEVVSKIKELLDTRVRPAVAQDGGDIVFHGFERGVVYLHMRGACAGCPSSTITLKNGIENLLRYYVPDVVEVRAVG